MVAHASLNSFYQSVKFSHPRTAAMMHGDIQKVAIFALGQDKTPAQESAENLRKIVQEQDLPGIHRRALENALTELGFS
jgi:hypothetical protein